MTMGRSNGIPVSCAWIDYDNGVRVDPSLMSGQLTWA